MRQVYADHTTKVDKVFSRIIETTQHPAAAASFASIMFAPQAKLSFSEALSKYVPIPEHLLNSIHRVFSKISFLVDTIYISPRCRDNNVSVCLMYGKEDPWVTPIWGRQVKRTLLDAPYYEISPAGHCPHDEVPEVTLTIFFTFRLQHSIIPRQFPPGKILTFPFPFHILLSQIINYLLRGWIKNLESDGTSGLPLLDNDLNSESTVDRKVEFIRDGVKKSVTVKYIDSNFSMLKWLTSFIRSVENIQMRSL